MWAVDWEHLTNLCFLQIISAVPVVSSTFWPWDILLKPLVKPFGVVCWFLLILVGSCCQFSTWVRPGKRTPPSVKFPSKNSGKNYFSGDLVGSILYTLKGPSKVANCQFLLILEKFSTFATHFQQGPFDGLAAWDFGLGSAAPSRVWMKTSINRWRLWALLAQFAPRIQVHSSHVLSKVYSILVCSVTDIYIYIL